MRRRDFFGALLATPVGLASAQQPQETRQGFRIAAGADRLGGPIRLPGSNSPLWVKLATNDTDARFFLTQQAHAQRGGPRRHLHFDVDEWWYCLAGEYVVEVGGKRYPLQKGDSVFGPRRIPHTFALVSNTPGEILVGFSPAGRMEEFFQESSRRGRNVDPNDAQATERLRYFGMETVGAALEI
jgi:mannose-6-phosphate isomerase-like protein (cupin superfamily)